jgi:predicted nucleic acid-binding protein
MTRSSRAKSSRRFTLDTNLLVYSIDDTEGARYELARQIVDRAVDADCWLTLQSLSEFYWATRRKNAVPREEAAAQVEDWLSLFSCIPSSPTAIRRALADNLAGRASYWDALLVATAAEGGCTLVLTEDMADGSLLSGVQIHNPFAGEGLTELTRQLLDL